MFSSYQIHVIYPQSTIKKNCAQRKPMPFLFSPVSSQSDEKIALRSESTSFLCFFSSLPKT